MDVLSPTLKVTVEAALTSNKVPIIKCFFILHQVVEFYTSQEYIGEYLVDGHQNWALVYGTIYGEYVDSQIQMPMFIVDCREPWPSIHVAQRHSGITLQRKLPVEASKEELVLWRENRGAKYALHYLKILRVPIATMMERH